MNEVGEGPDNRYAGEGNAEQDDVQEADAQDVRQPHSSAVHHSGVGVHLAVRRAHIHDGALPTEQTLNDLCLNSAAYLTSQNTDLLGHTANGSNVSSVQIKWTGK